MREHAGSFYLIRLSPGMVVALVDIELDTQAESSPRWNTNTIKALDVRGLITLNGRKLTKKGRQYLEACRCEYETANKWIEAVLEEAA